MPGRSGVESPDPRGGAAEGPTAGTARPYAFFGAGPYP